MDRESNNSKSLGWSFKIFCFFFLLPIFSGLLLLLLYLFDRRPWKIINSRMCLASRFRPLVTERHRDERDGKSQKSVVNCFNDNGRPTCYPISKCKCCCALRGAPDVVLIRIEREEAYSVSHCKALLYIWFAPISCCCCCCCCCLLSLFPIWFR